MGGCQSKPLEEPPAASTPTTKATLPGGRAAAKTTPHEPATTTPDVPTKPQPMIFAIMRNGHEVIRGAMRDLDALLASKRTTTTIDEAQRAWEDLHRWSKLHATMEEGRRKEDGNPDAKASPRGFFRLLDMHCDSVATREGLFDAHADLHQKETAVTQAFDEARASAASQSDEDRIAHIRRVFQAFMEDNEAHLKHEEDVMMPMVQKLVKEGHPMKAYMKQDILATVTQAGETQFFITYAVRVLERHTTADKPRFRVFAHALWAVATPEEWEEASWKEWIRSSVAPETYQELVDVLPS